MFIFYIRMPRRRLSSDGLGLFNVAMYMAPRRSKIKQLLSCFFRTDYDDRLEAMVDQCRVASKQLYSYQADPILKKKIKKYIQELGLKFVQLHGNEDANYINELNKSDVKVIKKISIKNYKDMEKINDFMNANYFLFDYKPSKNESLTLFCIAKPSALPITIQFVTIKAIKTDKDLLKSYIYAASALSIKETSVDITVNCTIILTLDGI